MTNPNSYMNNSVQIIYNINPVLTFYFDYFGNQLSEIPAEAEVVIPVTKEEMFEKLRAYRNELLAGCDWTMLPDVQMTETIRQLWVQYRQDLRDFPSAVDVAQWTAPAWPIAPSSEMARVLETVTPPA